MIRAYEARVTDISCSAEGRVTDYSLMALLIRASQEEADTSASEVYGNMFAFNFAGHDTVVHTFAFALYFISAHPEVQDWLFEKFRPSQEVVS